MTYEQVNSSPYLNNWFLSKFIDFNDLQIYDKMAIKAGSNEGLINCSFTQQTLTFLMRCIDLSIFHVDNAEKYM